MKYSMLITIIIPILSASIVCAQDENHSTSFYPGGISLQYGYGTFATKDYYISPERYAGNMPFYYIAWARPHNRYVYNLNFGFKLSEKITNYNVTTRILQFRFSQGFLYALKPISPGGKTLSFWIGPTSDISYYVNNPDIAVSGFDYTNSFVTMVSLGFRGDAFYNLAEKFRLGSSLQFTLVSLGLRTVDREEDNQPEAKILSPLSGLNGSFSLTIEYDIFKWLSLNAGYRFDILRVTGWEDLIAAGNSGIAGVVFRF